MSAASREVLIGWIVVVRPGSLAPCLGLRERYGAAHARPKLASKRRIDRPVPLSSRADQLRWRFAGVSERNAMANRPRYWPIYRRYKHVYTADEPACAHSARQ
jgi:hypothetical protein